MGEGRVCRVAIIGAGYTAREHIRAFSDVEGARLVGISSRTRSRAEQIASEFGIPQVSDSVDKLCSETRADLVVVTVNEPSMKGVSFACFDNAWAVLMEKPPGLKPDETEEIRARAAAKGCRVRVALNRQSYSVTRIAREELRACGGRRFVKVQDQENPGAALRARTPAEVTGNWMYANSIHMLDYFRLFARGKASAVETVIPWDPRRSPCVVVSRILFESGDEGLYEAVWNGPGPWAVSITVPGKRWELRPLEQGQRQELGQKPVPMEPDPVDGCFKPGFRYQAEQAVRLALGEPSDLPTLEDALQTMQLIQAIYPSAWVPPPSEGAKVSVFFAGAEGRREPRRRS